MPCSGTGRLAPLYANRIIPSEPVNEVTHMAPWDPDTLPSPTEDIDRLKSDLDRCGYCLISNALTAVQIERMRARIEEQAAAERTLGHEFLDQAEAEDNRNQWVYMLINKGRVLWDLVLHPGANELIRHLLGPEYQLSSFSAHITHPGGRLMPLHTDQWWMPPPVTPGSAHTRAGTIERTGHSAAEPAAATTAISPPVVVNIMWMLVDFTEENGATRIVPGSHLSGAQPDSTVPHTTATVAAVAPAGAALMWEGRTWHSAGLNIGNRSRYGITTAYCGPQFRPMENYTLGTRPELLAEMPVDLRRMLGFKVWSGYGKTDDPQAELAMPGEQTIDELQP